MTNEELAIEIQNGNTEYLPVLFDQVEQFIRKKAAQRLRVLGENSGIEFDELYDSGYLAVIEAAKYFDPESGYKFLTFLDRPLKKAFSEVTNVRSQKGLKDPLRNAVSLETPVGEDETLTIGDTIADDTDITAEVIRKVSNQELHKALDNALDRLEPLEAEAIRLQYYSNLNLQQSAVAMKIEPDKVWYLRLSGMRKLRTPEIASELEKYLNAPKNKRKRRLADPAEKNIAFNTHFDALRARCGLCT